MKIGNLTDEMMAVLLEQPKTCNKCQRGLKIKDFEITTARGAKVVRSHCRECMKAYYALVASLRVKSSAVKFVIKEQKFGNYFILRTINGSLPKVVGDYKSIKDAQNAVRRLRQRWSGYKIKRRKNETDRPGNSETDCTR